jgi:hypothetical protein
VDSGGALGAGAASRDHLYGGDRFGHRLARSTVRGTQTTTQVGSALDPLTGASTAQFDSAWSGQPTISATNMRRILLNAAGQGIIWTWDDTDPLVVSAGAGLALVNRAGTTAAILSVNMEWDEG